MLLKDTLWRKLSGEHLVLILKTGKNGKIIEFILDQVCQNQKYFCTGLMIFGSKLWYEASPC